MKKNRKTKKESELKSEFGTILEDVDSKFSLILEQTTHVLKEIPVIKKSITSMEGRLEVIETNIEIMKHSLKIKIDQDDFKDLERRVSVLESKINPKRTA